jgi:hypothetical protein
MARTARLVAVRLRLMTQRLWLWGAAIIGFAAALARPTQSWAGLRWPRCGGDSEFSPGSGLPWDKGNRSPRLSFVVRFELELGRG